ncbi:MFS transporter, partial [Acinetobacter baumannii]
LIAFVGTINPSSGDVSVFLPLEQARLSETVPNRGRTALFARYSLIGSLAAAVGSLCAGAPEVLAGATGIDTGMAFDGAFLLYALLGLAS